MSCSSSVMYVISPHSLTPQEYMERDEVLKLRAAGLKKVGILINNGNACMLPMVIGGLQYKCSMVCVNEQWTALHRKMPVFS